EGSFHDYYPEAYRLINHEYCWVEGFSFSLGTDAYFGRLDQYDKGLITGTIRDDRLLRTDILRMLGADKRCAVNQAVAKLIDAGGNVLDTYQCDTIRNGIYLFKYVDPGTYTVEVSHPDYFTQTAQVVVNANAKTYQNFDLKRVRNTPPEVIKYSPMWNEGDPEILCSSSVVLDFNWDMDTESVEEAFSVEPALEGMFKWEDANYRMIFTPNDAFEANTLYTIRLGKEAMHGGGTPMVEDFEFTVRTTARKHLNTLAMFPDEGDEVHYKVGAFIEFRTDSLLDGHDLFTRFHVYDSEGTELDFNKRNIKNNKKGDPYGYIRLPLLKALNPGDAYKVVLDREVCDTVGVHLPSQLTFNFIAIDAAQIPEGATIVDGFESVAMEVDDDASANVKSAALGASTEKLEGSKSLQLKYEFLTPNEGKIRLAYPVPAGAPMLNDASAMEFVNGDELGLSICGDMSYNRVVGIFAAGGEEIAVPLSKLTYHGWRTVSVKLEGLSGDMPYELVGLELENGGTVMGASGTIRFDQLTRVPTSGIDERTVAGVHVGPNPANEYLVASADSYISGVELLDANGRVITRHNGNFINVSGIATGVYFMRVWVNGMPSTHKVMVKH
ncbi:MAG: T9SS type A sorting domain-containing protein, partial [Muribaculaceae bacterium]|nr:T9SS type A sorting domain-containing protein [Muribaculaceae bacterium]